MIELYDIVPATLAHAEELAANMQQADVDEIWALAHITPIEAVNMSLRASLDPRTGLAEGKVIVMFGIAKATFLSPVAVPWLLATDDIKTHSKHFLRHSRIYFERYKANNEMMVNYVDDRHKGAIRWLEWMGFTMHDPQPFGIDQLPFRKFEIGLS